MPTNYRKPPSFKFQRPTAIDFRRDFIGGLQREKPGICGGPWCPGPLPVPPGPSREKASQVVWHVSSSEVHLFRLSPAPCISLKQKTRVRQARPWFQGAGPMRRRTGKCPREACFIFTYLRPLIYIKPGTPLNHSIAIFARISSASTLPQ